MVVFARALASAHLEEARARATFESCARLTFSSTRNKRNVLARTLKFKSKVKIPPRLSVVAFDRSKGATNIIYARHESQRERVTKSGFVVVGGFRYFVCVCVICGRSRGRQREKDTRDELRNWV